MIKKIILTVLGSTIVGLVLLSFIDVYQEQDTKEVSAFTYALGNINNDLRDVTNLSMREKDIITATSKSLVSKNSDGKIENELSQEVKVKDDNIEYEFILKDDIKWSDGTQILPVQIIDFFKELLITEEEKNIEPILNIYGAREFRESNGNDNSKLALIEGDNSIIIRLNSKDKDFLEKLTKPVYKLRKNLDMWKDIKSYHDNIVYSGDYVIDTVSDEEIILKRVNYLNENIPQEINIIRNMSEEVSMAKFETGEVDVVVNPPSKQLNRLEAEGRLKTFNANKGKYIYLNSNDKGLDFESRKAVYKTLNNVIETYHKENEHYIEVAEYSYFLEDKNNLNSIQERKVQTAKINKELPKIVTLLALDTQENRSLCAYIGEWFKNNTKTSLRYTLVNEDEYKNIALRDRYDITLIDIDLSANNREKTFSDLEYWYNDNEKKLFDKENSKNNSEFRELENTLFSNYRILPLFFENKNVAISNKVKEINFDYYGNIQFTKLKNK